MLTRTRLLWQVGVRPGFARTRHGAPVNAPAALEMSGDARWAPAEGRSWRSVALCTTVSLTPVSGGGAQVGGIASPANFDAKTLTDARKWGVDERPPPLRPFLLFLCREVGGLRTFWQARVGPRGKGEYVRMLTGEGEARGARGGVGAH